MTREKNFLQVLFNHLKAYLKKKKSQFMGHTEISDGMDLASARSSLWSLVINHSRGKEPQVSRIYIEGKRML